MDTKNEVAENSDPGLDLYTLDIAGKLATVVREVTGAAVGYMKDALFAEGIITPKDLHKDLPADAFPPTAAPMPRVKVDTQMIELEKRAEAEAREVQKEVQLAEKKKRALAVALVSVKV